MVPARGSSNMLVAGLQHRDRDAAAGEVERGRQPDRAGAGDENAMQVPTIGAAVDVVS